MKVVDFVQAVLGDEANELETALHELEGFFDIDVLTGENLLLIGDLVGMQEEGFSDETIRLLIKGKISENSSNGSIQDVIDAFSDMTGNNEQLVFEVVETFPRTVSITISTSDITSDTDLQTIIFNAMEKVVAAGIKFGWITTYNVAGFRLNTDGRGLDQGILNEIIT